MCFVLATSCSSGGESAPPPPACGPVCGRLSGCGAGSCNCATFDRWRTDIRDGFFACVNDKSTPCDSKLAETCIFKAAAPAPPRAIDDAYVTACVNKRKDCGNVYPDDYCSSRLFADEWVVKLQTCLGKPCTEVGMCLEAILK